MAKLTGFLREQPFWIDGAILFLVSLHLYATWQEWVPNIWSALTNQTDRGSVEAIYLSLLGPAAIVAGFAGVVVVFGISASSDRFKTFRANAGKSLKRTWVSSSLSGFEAVALAVAAALFSVSELSLAAPFAFEAALLLLAHGAARLIWILSQMIGIVRADDVQAKTAENTFKLERLPGGRRAG